MECENTHFLSDDSCIDRSTTEGIPKCQKLSLTQDLICIECVNNYTLWHNDTECLLKIPNCKEHTFNITKNLLDCIKCNETYFLD